MNKFLKVVRSESVFNEIEKDLESDNANKELKYLDFHKSRFDYILKLCQKYFKPGKKLLDIGSLFGHLCRGAQLIGYETYGLDLPKYVEEFADRFRNFQINNIACNLEKEPAPFARNKFDVIVAGEVLEHFNFYPDRFFAEIVRMLKPGGILILTTPNLMRLNNVLKMFVGAKKNWDTKNDLINRDNCREFTAAEIVYLIKKSGLKVKKLEYKNFNNPNLGYFNRLFNELSGLVLPHRKGGVVIVAKKPLS